MAIDRKQIVKSLAESIAKVLREEDASKNIPLEDLSTAKPRRYHSI